jgi:hypothetical protein
MKRSIAALSMIGALVSLTLVISSCKKEDNPAAPPPVVEHPPATTVVLILKDSLGTATLDTCVVRDTSLVHGQPPQEGQLDLLAGGSYRGTFALYDETKSPREDITADIIAEKDAHVFKFRFTGADTTRVVISDLDVDSHGFPFGLNFRITATPGGTASGNLRVILEHHDDGNKNGTEFDLDLDRDFPVIMQ